MLPEPIHRSRWIKRLTHLVPLALAACCILLLQWLGGLTFPSTAAMLLWHMLPHLGQLVRERDVSALVAFGGLVTLLLSCVLLWVALFACLGRFIWSFLLRRHYGAIAFARWLRRPASIQYVTACSPQAGDPAVAVEARQITRAMARRNVMACVAVCAEAEANATTSAREACLLMQDACRAAVASAVPDARSDEMLGMWAKSCIQAMHAAMQVSNRHEDSACRGSVALCLLVGDLAVVTLIGRAAAYVVEEHDGPESLAVTPVRIKADLRFLGEVAPITPGLTLRRPLQVSQHVSLVLAAGPSLPQAAHIATAWQACADLEARATRITGVSPISPAVPLPHRAIGVVAQSSEARRYR